MPDARDVYRRHAEQYDLLVAREDHAGNLLKAIRELVPLEGADAGALLLRPGAC